MRLFFLTWLSRLRPQKLESKRIQRVGSQERKLRRGNKETSNTSSISQGSRRKPEDLSKTCSSGRGQKQVRGGEQVRRTSFGYRKQEERRKKIEIRPRRLRNRKNGPVEEEKQPFSRAHIKFMKGFFWRENGNLLSHHPHPPKKTQNKRYLQGVWRRISEWASTPNI